MIGLKISEIYKKRFADTLNFRNKMWQVLCRDFFQKFIPEDSTILELGSGYCEFINNIKARRKIALDINEDTKLIANKDVEVIITRSIDLSTINSDSIDRIFISHLFEHLDRKEIVKTLLEIKRCLRTSGQILILQPNIRFIYKDYWMFFDHITPIDDRALIETLEIIGFKISLNIPKFLPFSVKSRLPKILFLVKLYLKMPFLWRIFGGQAFVIAEK